MIRTVVKILFAGILATALVVAQQPEVEEDFDEATIILPGDLSATAKQQLFQAIQGVPSEVSTGDGDAYLLVPGNATVIIITPEDLASNTEKVPPPSKEIYSPRVSIQSSASPQNSLTSQSQSYAPQPLHNSSTASDNIAKTTTLPQNKLASADAGVGVGVDVVVPMEESFNTECTDIPPSQYYSCKQQAEFGKCNAQFILEGNYCAATCGRCTIISDGPMEVSQSECVPLSVLLLTRNDTQSFRDAVSTVKLDRLFSDPDYSATVFIPNDQAFYQALQILGQTSPQLTRLSMLKNLIEGHILPNTAIQSQNFVDNQQLQTLSRNSIWSIQTAEKYIQIVGGGLGPANIIESDISSCNVVAHIVDTVLVGGVF